MGQSGGGDCGWGNGGGCKWGWGWGYWSSHFSVFYFGLNFTLMPSSVQNEKSTSRISLVHHAFHINTLHFNTTHTM